MYIHYKHVFLRQVSHLLYVYIGVKTVYYM